MNKADKLIDWLTGDREDFSILEDLPVVPMPEIAQKNANNGIPDHDCKQESCKVCLDYWREGKI